MNSSFVQASHVSNYVQLEYFAMLQYTALLKDIIEISLNPSERNLDGYI